MRYFLFKPKPIFIRWLLPYVTYLSHLIETNISKGNNQRRERIVTYILLSEKKTTTVFNANS